MTVVRYVRAAAAQLDVLGGEARPLCLNRERTVQLRRGSDIVPKPICWLWPGWLPAGKLTILAGAGGTGKTTLTLSLAAVVTSAGQWPDGTKAAAPGNVIIWSGEDNPDDTLVPRLIAAGANMDRCFFINGIAQEGQTVAFDPAIDMHELNKKIGEIGGVSLLIVDPIVSAVAGDMHKANDVRRSLQAVVDFAAAHDCAVIGITHFAKGGEGRSPADRVIGSQAFSALARMVLVAAKKEDSSIRVLARAKSNIAADDGGVGYSIEMASIAGGIEAARVVWDGPIDGTAREILGDVEFGEHSDSSSKTGAEKFLRDLLANGPVFTNQIKADAHAAGHSVATLRRAKKSLRAEAIHYGYGKTGMWAWQLPAKVTKETKGAPAISVSTFEENEHLCGEEVGRMDEHPLRTVP